MGVTGALTLGLYWPSEIFGDTEFGSNNEGAASTISAVGSDVVTAGVGAGLSAKHITSEIGGTILNGDVGGILRGVGHEAVGRASGNMSQTAGGMLSRYVGHYGLKANNYAGYKGIAGFVANIAIGTFADKYENGLARETALKAQKFDESDMSKGINVLAIEA